MMKQKTNQAARKRFTMSARGKAKRRPVHQSHFNGKDTGEETRHKHVSAPVSPADRQRLRNLLPYQ